MKGRGDRPSRVAERIREEISLCIQFKVKDPGVAGVTITDVRVTSDLKLARVNYSVLGDAEAITVAKRALRRASGFLRAEVGRALNLRYSPELTFFIDQSYDRGVYIDHLLHEIAKEGEAKPEGDGEDDDE
jgi:ribosome-binding factor A